MKYRVDADKLDTVRDGLLDETCDRFLDEICDKFLDETMELNDLPAVAIGVSVGGSVDGFVGGVVGSAVGGAAGGSGGGAGGGSIGGVEYTGLRCDEHFRFNNLTADSIFHCASVSKLFTSTAIMKLVEAGVLNLYDRLCDLLPDMEYAGEIRLWNLLTHTSGLGDCDDYQWYNARCDEDALRDYVYKSADAVGQPMLWNPQTAPEFYGPVTDAHGNPAGYFRYSNVAYEILGQIVAEYSHRLYGESLSYEDFVRIYLLEPAGMSSSTMKTFERCDFNDGDARAAADMAAPFEKAPDKSIVPVEFYPYNRMHGPSSTLTSNVSDLLKWGRAHLKSASGEDEVVLHRETYDTVWRDYATVPNNGEKMGIGWFMRKQTAGAGGTSGRPREFTLYGHEGSDDGFRASFWICPELDMVTVVLSNLSQAPVKKINKKLFTKITEILPL